MKRLTEHLRLRTVNQILKQLLAPSLTSQVEGVFRQSLRGAQFLGVMLSFSLAYSLWLEWTTGTPLNAVLTAVQLVASIAIVLLPVFVTSVRGIARLFGVLMLLLAVLEMETQFHDVYFDYSDARSWLTNIALMAAFALFHVGRPIQFLSVWVIAFVFYTARLFVLSGFAVPPPLKPMMGTILPLAFIWVIVNTWWFRIRLQYVAAGENLQAANAKLKEIDRFRSNFFAGISHEFRTPLTLILSPLTAISDTVQNNTELSLYLQSVRKNGNRLLTLVNNLIDLARLDSGRMDLHLEAVDLCELIRGVLAVFEQSFRSRGLSLRSELPLQLLTRIDVEKTETILINLLGNALKYTESGGATLRLKQESNRIAVIIEDTGSGIDLQHRQSLFERFGAVRTSRSGSGLGLSLSRELARFMEGDLLLRSSSEKGSTFELTMPLHPILFNEKKSSLVTSSFSLPDQSRQPTAQTIRSDAPLILIAEDDADLRAYLQRIVGERFSSVTAENGDEAFRMAVDRLPDVVVTDIVMPRMDGFDLLQRFRENRQMRNIPFLFLTARAGLEDRLEGLRLGGDDYLVKPFDPPELLEKVSVLIRRKRREEEGLRSERQSLVGDLHDMVGSDLTDLLILLGSLEPSDKVERARQLARSVLGSLRDRIHEREDMELIHDNFMIGVKVILNRRYSSVGRGIRFRFDHDEEELFVSHIGKSSRHVLYSVFLEISTNDLKYGRGISNWEFSYRDSTLRAVFRAQSAQDTIGRLSFLKRLEEEGGQCSEKKEHNQYTFRLKMQLPSEGSPAS